MSQDIKAARALEAAVDVAHAMIMARISHPRRLILPHLENLEPLEAWALLGELICDTLPRFPPDQRARMRAALRAALDEAS